MKRLLLVVLSGLSLAACATPQPTIYQPASGSQGVGFSEMRIEPGRYRVTFHAGSGAPPAQAQDYALRRAADLAVADGYDWFRVCGRDLGWTGGNGPRIGLGVGGASFGRGSAVGGSVGTGFNLGGGPAPVATLEVVMGKGARPPGPDVYDARGVQQTIARPA
ncbi:MAG: CC0125/CC1285 family lipoprotein [Phenylobacterium sp.]